MSLVMHDGRGGVLPCGTFEMDEPDAEGDRGGDRMTIRGLAAPIGKPLRTQKTRAFEKQSLRAIVGKVAGEAGLSLEGDIAALRFERVTQRRERDLEFLTRLPRIPGIISLCADPAPSSPASDPSTAAPRRLSSAISCSAPASCPTG
jgi:phage protein D